MEEISFIELVKTDDVSKAKYILSKKGDLHFIFFKLLVKMWIKESWDDLEVLKHMSNEMYFVFKNYDICITTERVWNDIPDVNELRVVFFLQNSAFSDYNYFSKHFMGQTVAGEVSDRSCIKFHSKSHKVFFEYGIVKNIDYYILAFCETDDDIAMCINATEKSRKYFSNHMYNVGDSQQKFKKVYVKLYNFFKSEKSKDYFSTFKQETKNAMESEYARDIIKEVMMSTPFPTKEMKEFRDELFPPEKGLFNRIFN